MTDPYFHGRREVAFRYDVIRDGVKYSEITALDVPTIETTYNAEVKMSLTGNFQYNPDVNLLSDSIRPMMRIDKTWYPLGEYAVATMEGNQLHAYDRALFLQQSTTEKRTLFHSGNRYIDVIQAILLENNIQRIIVPEDSQEVLQTDREFEIGTPYLTIVNQFLNEINFNSIWFDLEGNAQLTRYIPPNRAEIKHVYKNDECSILSVDPSNSIDIYSAYNVFIKTVSCPDYPFPMVARAVNDDPNSPLSTVRRGRRIVCPDIQMDNIASQRALQEHVNNLMERSKLSAETISFETANMPTHSVRDLVSLTCGKFSGIVEETHWSMSLSYSGKMVHEGKVVRL